VALVVEYTSTFLANVGNDLVGVLLVCVDSSFLIVSSPVKVFRVCYALILTLSACLSTDL
jgi:hypothetical protein